MEYNIAMSDNVAPQPDPIFEPVTQKWIRGAFAEWYRRYGLDVTGYPLTEQYVDQETGLPTQYFQRVALEDYHGYIRLRLAGQEALLSRTDLDAAREQARLAGEQAAQAQTQARTAGEQLKAAQDSARALEQQLAAARSDVQRLNNEAAQLRADLRALRDAAAKPSASQPNPGAGAAATVQELTAKLAQRDRELGDAQLHLATMERELQTRDARMAEQAAQIARLTAQLQAGGGPTASLPMPALQNVVDRLQQHPTERYTTRPLDAIRQICIHHSAVSGATTAEIIAKYHVEEHGWPGIGYHYYIRPDGSIQQTQRLETVSWHVSKHNDASVGVCLAGDFTYSPPSQVQVDSAARLVAWLMQERGVVEANVMGHKEFPDNDTSCPGETWLRNVAWKNALFDAIRREQARIQPGGGAKSLNHYMLFWQKADSWAEQDWQAAVRYIARFRPTAGFSVDDARQAQYVSIVGGVAGVSFETEQALRAAGCRVERIAGVDFADTQRLLDEMAASGRRFLTF